MTEWWTYRPGDFLMFAPRTYWRLFELHNQAWWPAPVLFVAVGLLAGLGLVARRRAPLPLRAALVGLALAWAGVGWFFLHERFAPIHWAMNGAAWVFLAQALGLIALASAADLRAAPARAARVGGAWLAGWGVLVQPLLAGVAGRPWLQAEVFGLAPDPTVITTLGLLLWVAPRSGATRVLFEALWAVALAWCVLSAATLWTMGSAQGAVPAVAAAGATVWRWWSGRWQPAAADVDVSAPASPPERA